MKKIYKYPLHITAHQYIDIPERAEILTVQMQNGTPALWAEVDTANLMAKRGIVLVGTGHAVPELLTYIGTVQDTAGFVWHYYDDGEL